MMIASQAIPSPNEKKPAPPILQQQQQEQQQQQQQQAIVHDKTVGDFTIETASHPDPNKNWSLVSAMTTSNDQRETEKMNLATLTLFQDFYNDPKSPQEYFYQMRKDNQYIKTRFFRQPVKNQDLLHELIIALGANGLSLLVQLCPGHGVPRILTSTHQDGANAHGRLHRMNIRFGGATEFMKSSSEHSVFYSADATNKMRATLATPNAFCGQCSDDDDGSKPAPGEMMTSHRFYWWSSKRRRMCR
jgi:hypothetical protein